MRALLAAACLLTPSAWAQKPPIALGKAPTPLLGGRLSARLPEKAKLQARQVSIMAAPESNEVETRAVLDAEGARFVIMTYELVQTGGPKFEEVARQSIGRERPKAKLEKPTSAAPLPVVAAEIPPGAPEEANLVYTARVLHPDGTVQRLDFYVNDKGLGAAARWADLGRRVTQSLTVGPRKLELAAGPRRFRGVATDKLVLRVPQGFLASTQEGPDFFVHHLSRAVPLDGGAESCNLYLGGHPQLRHESAGVPVAAITRVPGKLFEKAADFDGWTHGNGSCIEAIVPHPLGAAQHLVVHAFCCTKEQARLAELKRILETLSVEK
jgi:hypothetical protein